MSNSPIKIYDARWETGDFSFEEIENLFLSSCAYGSKMDIDTVDVKENTNRQKDKTGGI